MVNNAARCVDGTSLTVGCPGATANVFGVTRHVVGVVVGTGLGRVVAVRPLAVGVGLGFDVTVGRGVGVGLSVGVGFSVGAALGLGDSVGG
ncbi:MAG TPA: hypothetical protein VKB59_04840, partial [Micromonosporaceae bacterium]|nr:hypothetical protein [Micromonosporaceae bacterium]